jgi:hypothetical protein
VHDEQDGERRLKDGTPFSKSLFAYAGQLGRTYGPCRSASGRPSAVAKEAGELARMRASGDEYDVRNAFLDVRLDNAGDRPPAV